MFRKPSEVIAPLPSREVTALCAQDAGPGRFTTGGEPRSIFTSALSRCTVATAPAIRSISA